IAKLLGLAQENQEAVKECYKEYIGMAKRYYEGAKGQSRKSQKLWWEKAAELPG
ncbi:hypothetical protein Tco_1231154, partial [Tanacetum coccineum]